MSAVKLNTASGGSISLAPTNTASDVVVTVPAGTSTMVTNATLPTQLNASGSAPIYACRAWVNFNGTGTVAIRASGNVSSITDGGEGKYTVNFTTAMPDANYAYQVTSDSRGTSDRFIFGYLDPVLTTTSLAINAYGNPNGSAWSIGTSDSSFVTISIFR